MSSSSSEADESLETQLTKLRYRYSIYAEKMTKLNRKICKLMKRTPGKHTGTQTLLDLMEPSGLLDINPDEWQLETKLLKNPQENAMTQTIQENAMTQTILANVPSSAVYPKIADHNSNTFKNIPDSILQVGDARNSGSQAPHHSKTAFYLKPEEKSDELNPLSSTIMKEANSNERKLNSDTMPFPSRSSQIIPLPSSSKTILPYKTSGSNAKVNILPSNVVGNNLIGNAPSHHKAKYAKSDVQSSDFFACSTKKTHVSLDGEVKYTEPFSRKPRDLLLPETFLNNDLKDVVIVSNLSGDLNIYAAGERLLFDRIGPKVLENYFSENICWVDRDILAVAAACPRLAQKGQQPWENQQLSILYNCKVDYERGLARSFTFKKYRFSNMPHRPGTGISVIASIDNTKWITGGTDRKIVLWDVGSSKPFNQCATEDLHNLHTSAILSMFYDNRSQTIYSGGQDCRILGWSLSEQRNLLSDERKGGAVRDIIPISTHPSLLLLGIIDKAHSLQVFDTRTQKSELCIETNNSGASADENSNSRYVKASIHENGYLVSMGIQNSVCIWDLRYVKPQTPCASLGNIHNKRVVGAKFFKTFGRREWLISTSHDNHVAFSNVKIT